MNLELIADFAEEQAGATGDGAFDTISDMAREAMTADAYRARLDAMVAALVSRANAPGPFSAKNRIEIVSQATAALAAIDRAVEAKR